LHSAKILRLSEDFPIVVEIIDRQPKIDEFLAEANGMMRSGLGDPRKNTSPAIRQCDQLAARLERRGER
jgi:hypothetical protein